jgi:hypothetical protein
MEPTDPGSESETPSNAADWVLGSALGILFALRLFGFLAALLLFVLSHMDPVLSRMDPGVIRVFAGTLVPCGIFYGVASVHRAIRQRSHESSEAGRIARPADGKRRRLDALWDRDLDVRNSDDHPMRLPRFTIRRMMVVVAIVCALLGVDRMARRRAYCLEQAKLWKERADEFVTGAGVCLKEEFDKPGMYTALYERTRAIERNYRHAARYPWLPVEPDPPWPE